MVDEQGMDGSHGDKSFRKRPAYGNAKGNRAGGRNAKPEQSKEAAEFAASLRKRWAEWGLD